MAPPLGLNGWLAGSLPHARGMGRQWLALVGNRLGHWLQAPVQAVVGGSLHGPPTRLRIATRSLTQFAWCKT